MSNPINNKAPVHEIPSLSIQASSCVLKHLEKSIQGKGNQALLWGMEREEACKAGLIQVWENLLVHPDQHPYLKLTMEKVQDLVIREALLKKFQCTYAIFGTLKVDPRNIDPRNTISLIQKLFVEACISDETIPGAVLPANGVQLFQKLANTFGLQSASTGLQSASTGLQSASTDFSVYKPWCDEQDKALELIWSKPIGGIAVRLHFHGPGLTTASKIRAWMADPKHAQVLSQIKQLRLGNFSLKAIPIEILTLPKLDWLSLAECDIKVIPEELVTSKLKTLDLSHNQIKVIPEALAITSRLVALDLSYNQIKVIPEALAISNLTSLDLSYNQIKVIPEALATSKLLTNFNLCNNQVEVVPEAFATSQLTMFLLAGNQIKVLPKGFRESKRVLL
jgi:Leucine-rich repeat (LRR) protein